MTSKSYDLDGFQANSLNVTVSGGEAEIRVSLENNGEIDININLVNYDQLRFLNFITKRVMSDRNDKRVRKVKKIPYEQFNKLMEEQLREGELSTTCLQFGPFDEEDDESNWTDIDDENETIVNLSDLEEEDEAEANVVAVDAGRSPLEELLENITAVYNPILVGRPSKGNNVSKIDEMRFEAIQQMRDFICIPPTGTEENKWQALCEMLIEMILRKEVEIGKGSVKVVTDGCFMAARIICHLVSDNKLDEFQWNSLSEIDKKVFTYKGISGQSKAGFGQSNIKLIQNFFGGKARLSLLQEVIQIVKDGNEEEAREKAESIKKKCREQLKPRKK